MEAMGDLWGHFSGLLSTWTCLTAIFNQLGQCHVKSWVLLGAGNCHSVYPEKLEKAPCSEKPLHTSNCLPLPTSHYFDPKVDIGSLWKLENDIPQVDTLLSWAAKPGEWSKAWILGS